MKRSILQQGNLLDIWVSVRKHLPSFRRSIISNQSAGQGKASVSFLERKIWSLFCNTADRRERLLERLYPRQTRGRAIALPDCADARPLPGSRLSQWRNIQDSIISLVLVQWEPGLRDAFSDDAVAFVHLPIILSDLLRILVWWLLLLCLSIFNVNELEKFFDKLCYSKVKRRANCRHKTIAQRVLGWIARVSGEVGNA